MARLLSEIFQQFSAQLAHFYSPSEIRRLLSYKLSSLPVDFPNYPEFPLDFRLSAEHCAELEQYLAELITGKPYQYLLGKATFAKREFMVSEAVLIPRPETEELFFLIKKHFAATAPKRIIDFGTGSGCLAISLALEFPQSQVLGIDISKSALEIARQNASILLPAQNNIKFQQADIFHNDFILTPTSVPELWVSNPPYIPLSERQNLSPQVRDFEPPHALFVADATPFTFFTRILDLFLQLTLPPAQLFFEINAPSALQLKAQLVRQLPANYKIEIHQDLFGLNRFLHIFHA